MDEKLIAAWNAVVRTDDIILHCGDFALVNRVQIQAYRQRLNGIIWLALGNHDATATAHLACGFDVVAKRIAFDHPVHGRIICRHRPCDFTVADGEEATWLFHGHLHGNPQETVIDPLILPKLIDVGVDAVRTWPNGRVSYGPSEL